MTPSGVAMLVCPGPQRVASSKDAGLGSAIPDEAYVKAGAKIVATREEVWAARHGREGQGADRARVRAACARICCSSRTSTSRRRTSSARSCSNRGVNGVAYETIEPSPGDLPLLTPMSAVAGRMAVQAGATYLERERGGKGVLLGGVPGVKRGRVTDHRRRRRRPERGARWRSASARTSRCSTSTSRRSRTSTTSTAAASRRSTPIRSASSARCSRATSSIGAVLLARRARAAARHREDDQGRWSPAR